MSTENAAAERQQETANGECPHTSLYSAADSGLTPLSWHIRAHGARDLENHLFRAHVGQCPDCQGRFVRVRTWDPGTGAVIETGWAPLAPAMTETGALR